MKSKLYRLLYLLTNIMIYIINIFIRRDKRIWLFGAWMGNTFSDNPRHLFQYICDNKEILLIKNAIWVTRNRQVYHHLKDLGYQVYLCGTYQSFYWHIKAGVHVVCDIPNKIGNYSGDIDGLFSWGAIKLQTWHGVGIKACGRLKNDSLKSKAIRFNSNLRHYFYPGGWDKCYWLVTSKEDARVKSLDFNICEKQLIISCYPRNCKNLKSSDNERKIIDKIIELRNRSKIILYLPTFRSNIDESAFTTPTQIEGLIPFLQDNNLIWIEKRHAASTYCKNQIQSRNIMYIDSEFDVNLLYDYVDVVVSDYSSATSDAIAKNVKVLDYVPDYDLYVRDDRGFVADFKSYHPGITVKEPCKFISALEETISEEYFTKERRLQYDDCKSLLFDNIIPNMGMLCNQIIKMTLL